MQEYYVRIKPQSNGTNAVHKEGCPFMPDKSKRKYLGMFHSCQDAVREAKKHYLRSDRCLFCTKELSQSNGKTVHGWNNYYLRFLKE